jgi:hypothetical protein
MAVERSFLGSEISRETFCELHSHGSLRFERKAR